MKIIINDRLASWTGGVFFTLWIGQRYYFHYRPTFLWWLITFQFVLFVVAYLSRHKALQHARGFREIVFPFICAAMPFALENYPIKPKGVALTQLEPFSIGLMTLGTLFIITGIFYLRRSFSIMAEVREPVFSGIYRWSRHPMYLGSIFSSLGILLNYYHILNVCIFGVFCIFQIYRASLEEKKIMAVFPEYGRYASRVGWLWRLGTRRALS
ncbi:MAG: hypothetical protein JRI95_08155 [Deltaproteobacteria bacterium]|nr:hypothetical protein [Deltaproteobacteria bacterium]MBW2084779.1 hypothetical protein [Deltaproteobacteria bacterium]